MHDVEDAGSQGGVETHWISEMGIACYQDRSELSGNRKDALVVGAARKLFCNCSHLVAETSQTRGEGEADVLVEEDRRLHATRSAAR